MTYVCRLFKMRESAIQPRTHNIFHEILLLLLFIIRCVLQTVYNPNETHLGTVYYQEYFIAKSENRLWVYINNKARQQLVFKFYLNYFMKYFQSVYYQAYLFIILLSLTEKTK